MNSATRHPIIYTNLIFAYFIALNGILSNEVSTFYIYLENV